MLKYLIDTDWVIDYLFGVERVVNRINASIPGSLGLSIVSMAELYEGVFYARDPVADEHALRQFVAKVDILTLNDDICRIFARERGRLRAAGLMINDLDILIGATAIHHGRALLTNNRRHFERLEGIALGSA